MAAVIPAFITGLTLFVIPSWATSHVHIAADVKAKNSNNSYELRDSMVMVQWLPMIFAMPFTGTPIKIEKEVGENTYRSLILKMKNNGAFGKT